MSKKYFCLESAGFERHVEAFHGVRQGSDADKVDTLLSIVADGIEGDSPTRLRLVTMSNEVNGLLRVSHAEVVEHDTVYLEFWYTSINTSFNTTFIISSKDFEETTISPFIIPGVST